MPRNFTCNRHKLRPGARPAMEAWVREINCRSGEVEQSLRDEGIALELVLLEEAEDGDYLLFIMETDDYARALSVFEQSVLPVDAYHRTFLAENIVGSQRLTVLSCHAA